MPSINTVSGRQDMELDVLAYKAAGERGMSLTEHLQVQYPTNVERDGTAFEQLMNQAGLFMRADHSAGLRPPTMKQVLEGGLAIQAGAINRNDGANSNTVSGRLLFPEIVMQVIRSELEESNEDFLGGFDSMVAQTQNITGPKFDQPIINTTGPKADRNQPVGQLAEPAIMMSITVSEVTKRIPTKSIGLTISDEALDATTLDLVGLAVSAQAREERVQMVEGHLNSMITGDVDQGDSALSAVTAQSFDSGITAAGSLSQKAWIHYLRANYRKMNISHIICDVDTALAIEGRSGKPTNQSDDPNSPRIDTLFSVENLGITAPRVLLVDSAVIGGANIIVGLDSRYAIRRVVNVAASYEAIEQYVMRRATSMRFDYGETAHRLYDDAWAKMTLTV